MRQTQIYFAIYIFSLLFAEGVTGQTFCQTFSSARHIELENGESPAKVVAGFFNDDSLPDLATVNNNSNSVTIFPNDGSGNFFEQVDYFVGDCPMDIAASDFDNDGDDDLVVTNSGDDTITILLNNGTGTFDQTFDYVTGEYPQGVLASDVNNDGNHDILVTNTQSVTVFFGDGDGTFPDTFEFPGGLSIQDLALGDIDGDGDDDVATANFDSGDVSICLNNGNGIFFFHATLPTVKNPQKPQLADIDGDQDLDLVVSSSKAGEIWVYRNDGTGIFVSPEIYAVEFLGGVDLTMTDLNADGQCDIVAANSQGWLTILPNLGEGIFGTPIRFNAGEPSQFGFMGITIGDFDNHFGLDIVVANATSGLSVFLANGFGRTNQIREFYSFGFGPTDVKVADMNGDDHPDIVEAFGGNIFVVRFNDGQSNFKEFETTQVPGGFAHAIGDLNRDGIPDVVTANVVADSITVSFNDGSGVFPTQMTHEVGDRPFDVELADIDNDGDLDVLTTNEDSNDVSLLLNTGDGNLSQQLLLPCGNEPAEIALADIDADTDIDFIVTNQSDDTISIFENLNDGTFAPHQTVAVGIAPFGIAIADLDSDDDMDVAVGNQIGTVSVLLNDGFGNFNTPVEYDTGLFTLRVAVGDVFGDRLPEILTTNYMDNSISVLTSTDKGQFGRHIIYYPGNEPLGLTLADVNNDEQLDIIATNTEEPMQDAGTSIFMSNGCGLLNQIGDVNIDGVVDLLDINPFVNRMANFEFQIEADINRDGVVDLLDIDPFVEILSQ